VCAIASCQAFGDGGYVVAVTFPRFISHSWERKGVGGMVRVRRQRSPFGGIKSISPEVRTGE
jgi:hypothetical protein